MFLYTCIYLENATALGERTRVLHRRFCQFIAGGNHIGRIFRYTSKHLRYDVLHETDIITREMQSINGASIKVLDSSFERIAFKTF